MSPDVIIRAWKDESFRRGLSADERALLPANPAGLIELDDAQLEVAAGARPPVTCTVCGEVCCCI